MLLGGSCILLAVATISRSHLLAFAFIVLSGVGAYGPMAPFGYSRPKLCRSRIVGSVMGFSSTPSATLGAYFAPLIVGHLNKETDIFFSQDLHTLALYVVGAGLATFF